MSKVVGSAEGISITSMVLPRFLCFNDEIEVKEFWEMCVAPGSIPPLTDEQVKMKKALPVKIKLRSPWELDASSTPSSFHTGKRFKLLSNALKAAHFDKLIFMQDSYFEGSLPHLDEDRTIAIASSSEEEDVVAETTIAASSSLPVISLVWILTVLLPCIIKIEGEGSCFRDCVAWS